MKNQRGITLIALVITVVILLILATVSISMALGNNGILSQAKNGVEKHRTSSEEEQILLGFNAYQTAKLTGQNPSKLDVEGASVTENGEYGWIVDFATTGKSYKLSKNGIIEEDKPFDPVEWDKTASDEDCFVWASDDPNSEDYGLIVGFTGKSDNYTKLKSPSRCKKIIYDYDNYEERFGDVTREMSRGASGNIIKIEMPDTITDIGESVFGNGGFNSVQEVVLSKKLMRISNNTF